MMFRPRHFGLSLFTSSSKVLLMHERIEMTEVPQAHAVGQDRKVKIPYPTLKNKDNRK